ncbi:MAG: response regulator transcription factor [Gallionellaceae bacterium]|nr:MAG: response regulator transcription factor [Gallionellaceae bacterium]
MNRILLIEDFEDIRHWLAGLLCGAFGEVSITEAATVAQAYAHLDAQSYDLIVIDLNLPDGTGVDILHRIKTQGLTAHCVVATAYDDDAHLLSALHAGADGYLLKDQAGEQLVRDLHGILSGSPPLSPPIARRIMRLAKQEPATSLLVPLTPREEEVLTYIAKGLNRAEVAQVLSVSANTIATHVRSIYAKLDISSRAEAAVEALRRGLIST